MQRFQYKVLPAPRRGEKARNAKSTEERFAVALTRLMNELGAEGWEYVRADTLPCDERSGLTGTKTTFQNMLVFRRPLLTEADAVPDPAAAKATAGALRIVTSADAPARQVGAASSPEGVTPKLGGATAERPAE